MRATGAEDSTAAGEQLGASSRNSTENYHRIPECHFWMYTQKTQKQALKEICLHPCTFFTKAKRNNPTQTSIMEEWINKTLYILSVERYYSASEKEASLATNR